MYNVVFIMRTIRITDFSNSNNFIVNIYPLALVAGE